MTEEVLPVEIAVRVESAKEKVIKNRQVDADLDPVQDLDQVDADLDPGHGQDLGQKAPDIERIVVHLANRNQNPVLRHQ
jgi:hypothetical protein